MLGTPVAVSFESYEGKGAGGRFYVGDAPSLLEGALFAYAGKVKLIYMDPPFLTGGKFVMRARVGAQDWRSGKASMTLPAYEDNLSPEQYYAMMRRVFFASRELLREDGMIFVHCDLRASARLRLLLDEVFGEDNLLNEIVWVYHTGGARGDTSAASTTRFCFTARRAGTTSTSRRCCARRPSRAATTCAATSTRTAGVTARSARAGGVHLLRRRPGAAHRRVGRRQPPAAARPAAHRLRHSKTPGAARAHCALRFARGGDGARSLRRLGNDAGGRAAAKPAVCGRRPLRVGAQHPAPPLEGAPWELTRPARILPGACEVELREGVGFYHVRLLRLPFEEPLLDNWALGYLQGDRLRVLSQCVRSRRCPDLPAEMTLPVFAGEIGLRLSDVRGNCHYYKIRSKNLNNAPV